MWTVSDGTVIRIGGEVEGASLFALQLRRDLESGEAGITWVGRDYFIDPSDASQLDAFIRESAGHARLKVSGPKDLPPLQPPPDPPGVAGLPEHEYDPDAVY